MTVIFAQQARVGRFKFFIRELKQTTTTDARERHQTKGLRLQYIFSGVSRTSDVVRPSVSGPKALKKRCLRFAILNFTAKVQNIF